MARRFGFPTVAALEVGGSAVVPVPTSEVKRKVTLYGARNGKRFTVQDQSDSTGPGSRVTRLPDPEPQP